jgi:hypothetical protein
MKAFSLLILLSLFACSSHHEVDQKKDPIRFGLLSRQRQYTQCFLESDSYLGKNHKKIGSMNVYFLIDEKGKVQDEKIENSDFKDANLHACVLEQIRSITFLMPQGHGTTKVSQPINFTP